MSSISTDTEVNLFKTVYADKLQRLLPEDYLLSQDIPFSEKQKVGEKYVEGVVLTHETGITFGGNQMEAFELEAPVAGAVRQAEVIPYASVLGSIIPFGVMSRSAGGGEKAFFDATKHIVKNNIKSHSKFMEIIRFYGQADKLLGYVSFFTGTYRGVAFTTGDGALQSDVTGGAVTFVGGVSAADKAILLRPGYFAAGIWVGMEKVRLEQVDASNNVVASGQLLKVDALQGILFVDFDPVAATTLTSHRIAFKGMAASKEAIGAHKILSNTGTLFSIPTGDFSLWKGNKITLGSVKFTLERLQTGVANAVNRGGLDGDITVYENPRSWATMVTTEAGARRYDGSYKTSEAENGFEAITFYHQTGKAIIKAHRTVMEGDAFGFHLPDWSRSGSSEVSFTVPGSPREIIFPLENQAGWAFRSYSDQYLFCHSPAKSLLWEGINDEASS